MYHSLAVFFATAVAWFGFGLPEFWNFMIDVMSLDKLIDGVKHTTEIDLTFGLLAAGLHTIYFLVGTLMYYFLSRIIFNKLSTTQRHIFNVSGFIPLATGVFIGTQMLALEAYDSGFEPLTFYVNQFFTKTGNNSCATLASCTLTLAISLGYVFAEAVDNSRAFLSNGAASLASSLLKGFIFAFVVIKFGVGPAFERALGISPSDSTSNSPTSTIPFVVAAAFTHTVALLLGMFLTWTVDRILSLMASPRAPASIRLVVISGGNLLASFAGLALFFIWTTFAHTLFSKYVGDVADTQRSLLLTSVSYATFFFLGVIFLEKLKVVDRRGILLLSIFACGIALSLTPSQLPESDNAVALVSTVFSSTVANLQNVVVNFSVTHDFDSFAVWMFILGISYFISLGLTAISLADEIDPRSKVRKHPLDFDHLDPEFERQRRKTFPPAYPNGWYNILKSDTLAPGEVKSISCLGRHFAIFRGAKSKKVTVMHAFCPHLGANLGKGGRVVGDILVCPFHEWKFDENGECVDIPYTPKGKAGRIPKQACNKVYHSVERLGGVWLWFDAEDREPLYDMYDWSDIETTNKWYTLGDPVCMEFDQHVAEMVENAGDYYHFETLHDPLPYPPWLRPFINLGYKLHYTLEEEEEKKHLSYLTNHTHVNFLLFGYRFKIPFSEFFTKLTFDGPGSVLFQIFTPFGEIRSLKSTTPLAPFRTYTEDRFFAEKTVPRILTKYVELSFVGGLEQDREVWANKSYFYKPTFVKGDEPFKRFRKWYNQFYSEHSRDVADEQNLNLEW